MKSKTVTGFSNLFARALRCPALWFGVFCVIVGCAEEVSEPECITSPYTEQTIRFFEKSCYSEYPTALNTVEKDEKAQILKKQTELIYINLEKYTLETVPEQLAQGIEFDKLIILPDDKDKVTRFDPRVLEKILSALGTICADTLVFYNLDLDGFGSKNMIQRVGRLPGNFGRKETPELAPATPITRYTLSINTLLIQHNTIPAIAWLQKRVDLSQCRINLAIVGKLRLNNLELLDGFNAERIKILTLKDVKRLDSLECKLLREGSLPEELTMMTTTPVYPKISEQIARNILTKEWRALVVPIEVWKNLMSPSSSPKHLTAAELSIYTPQYGIYTELKNTSLPPMGDNIATVKVLRVDFYNKYWLALFPPIFSTIDWISRHFRGLEELSIEFVFGHNNFAEFFENNQVVITTNPSLKSIKMYDVECSGVVSKRDILCLSLEAWDLYRSGKLADELVNSPTDLSALLPEQQAIMNREEMDADDEVCCACMCTAADLQSTSPDIKVCILDHPKHTVCSRCLDAMVKSREDLKSRFLCCPFCQEKYSLPLVKNHIERNSQSVFELTTVNTPTTSYVLSFPNDDPDNMLRDEAWDIE
ncbi:hypothetical protein NEDG_01566 [Nematocida displodere]|uniref:RING-type domain-containing protein n=1 Tax=Nematocida displodere TaxID=1805483 RepID=A0A177EGR2_9MICR|nr:hypothetical protein NEDG_01566 [Nematocida displodere]